ncbi:MAG: hypothetical protein KUG75_00005, partial [Pseudomonadales bacterium]|nr:hypothetical protein [Pseudomonadales bacterium]
APALMIIIYILGQTHQSTWILWFMGIVTFSRYLIVVGIVFPKSLAIPNAMRFLGALGTYICGLGLCMALFQQGLNL